MKCCSLARGSRGLVSLLYRLATCLRSAVVLLSLVMVQVSSVAFGADDDTIERQKRDLADAEQRVQDLEQDLDSRRSQRGNLMKALEQSERHIADLARSGHQLAAMIEEQEQVLEKLRGRLATERKTLDRERNALGGLLRSAYAMGRGDRIRLLLDQEDPDHLSRVMSYYGYLNRFRVKRIETVTQRALRLEDLTRDAEAEKQRLIELAQKQNETQTRLATAQAERTALLRSLDQTIATRAERVTDLRAQTREMRLLLEQLERRARQLPEAELRQEPLQQRRGHLEWPIEGAPLLSHYGSSKEDGIQRWDGVFLGAPEGAEVRAVHPGRVIYADWLRGFGLLLIIEHDHELMTLYGHNQTLLKEPGEWVGAGDVIALSGTSGGRQSAGLYFAIRQHGRPLNPEKWCRRKAKPKRQSSASEPRAIERTSAALPESRELPYPGVAFSAVNSRTHVPVTPP